MAETLLSGELSQVNRQTPVIGRLPDALDQGTIADLPSKRIAEMNSDELVRVIQNAQLPFLSDEACEHLAFHDRQTLERLANLAQRCCFNRTTQPGSPVGKTMYERQNYNA